jgi:hypothetical protein
LLIWNGKINLSWKHHEFVASYIVLELMCVSVTARIYRGIP